MTEREIIAFESLVPDLQVRAELRISKMGLWRWDHSPVMAALGWPPPIYRGRYKFRDSTAYEQFKAKLARAAMVNRNMLLQKRRDTATT